jgi:hypothetical protein
MRSEENNMHVVASGRVFVARHRWIYWTTAALVAVAIGLLVKDRLDAVEAERTSWQQTRPVLVATADLVADGPIAAETVELPIAAVPPSAIAELPPEARLRQRVAAGEVIVGADLVAADGPARHAAPGTVVVGIIDTLSPTAAIGLPVRVASEGVVLADHGTIVGIDDDVTFVAVAERDGPMVAAAAQSGLASLMFLP